MSFGHRSIEKPAPTVRRGIAPQPHAAPTEDASPIVDRCSDVWQSFPKWQRQLMTFAGAVVAIVGVGIAANLLLNAVGTRPGTRTQPQSISDLVGYAGSKKIEFYLPINGVSNAIAQQNTALRKSCLMFNGGAMAENIRSGYVDAQWAEADKNNGRVTRTFDRSANFLVCLIANETDRFCLPAERKKIADVLVTYVEIAHQKSLRANGLLGTPSSQIDGRLVRAVETLSSNGQLTAKDFNNKVPAEFAPYISKGPSETCK
jgi:hypothetical protein